MIVAEQKDKVAVLGEFRESQQGIVVLRAYFATGKGQNNRAYDIFRWEFFPQQFTLKQWEKIDGSLIKFCFCFLCIGCIKQLNLIEINVSII